jgi:hypothetical protein
MAHTSHLRVSHVFFSQLHVYQHCISKHQNVEHKILPSVRLFRRREGRPGASCKRERWSFKAQYHLHGSHTYRLDGNNCIVGISSWTGLYKTQRIQDRLLELYVAVIEREYQKLIQAVEYVTNSFQYNRTFSEAPSPETDAAWMSIFPPHGGFFHDKTVASDGASLAVYHQLHCLVSIPNIPFHSVLTNRFYRTL